MSKQVNGKSKRQKLSGEEPKSENFVPDEFNRSIRIDYSTDVCSFCRQNHDFGVLLQKACAEDETSDEELAHIEFALQTNDTLDVNRIWASNYSLNQGDRRVFAHFFCAIKAPRVWFDGIKWMNLKSEISRSSRLVCCHCKKRGAAIGCCEPKCKIVLHLPCAISLGYKYSRYEPQFFCSDHLQRQRESVGASENSSRIDFSFGKESLAIQYPKEMKDLARERTIHEYHLFEDFRYVTLNLDSDTVTQSLRNVQDLECCTCLERCDDIQTCACLQAAGRRNYDYSGKLLSNDHKKPSARPEKVLECNLRCSCSIRRCTNRVVQQGIRTPLELFIVHRERRHGKTIVLQHSVGMHMGYSGWQYYDTTSREIVMLGVRARQNIARDSFICEVVGQYVIDNDNQNSADTWRRRIHHLLWIKNDHEKSKELCLDCSHNGNIGAFIRRSEQKSSNDVDNDDYFVDDCSDAASNEKEMLRMVYVYDQTQSDALPRLAIFANTDISAGTELLL